MLYLPWRQLRGKWMASLLNSHANATPKRWHLWEIESGFALNSTSEWKRVIALLYRRSRPPFHASSSSSSLLLSSLELIDTQVYEPGIRALLGNALHFCEVVVLESRTVPNGTTLSLRILQVIRLGARAIHKRVRGGHRNTRLRRQGAEPGEPKLPHPKPLTLNPRP